MNNLYLYFSGTGNTKHVVKKFIEYYEETEQYKLVSIEHNNLDYTSLFKASGTIFLAYPIHEGLLPHIMREFLEDNKELFRDKNIVTICSQLIFSGDGAALPYRQLKEVNCKLLHGIHVNMPNNLADMNFLPMKTIDDSTKQIQKAERKIAKVCTSIKSGKRSKDGLRFYSWFLGFFFQRAYTKHHYSSIRSNVKIHHDSCIDCNKCIMICPTDNLYSINKKIEVKDNCTICYRCVNECPTQSISIITKQKPKVQYILKDYN